MNQNVVPFSKKTHHEKRRKHAAKFFAALHGKDFASVQQNTGELRWSQNGLSLMVQSWPALLLRVKSAIELRLRLLREQIRIAKKRGTLIDRSR